MDKKYLSREIAELIKAATQNISESESEAIELNLVFIKLYRNLSIERRIEFIETLKEML